MLHNHNITQLSTPCHCQPVVAAPTSRRSYRPSPCKVRANHPSQAPSSSNGSTPPPPPPQQQQQEDDPVAAMLWAAQQQAGLKVVFEEHEDEDEVLDDIMADLEDPWMRNPSPPEWSELPLFAAPDASIGVSTPSSPAAADPDGAAPSSPQFATVNWQELEQLVQQQEEQQQRLVLLEVACPDSQEQQEQQPPCRPLPDPLPWLSSSSSSAVSSAQQQQGSQEQPPTSQQQQKQHQGSLQAGQVQVVRLELSTLTRGLAAQWQQQGAVVAVWDSGHHSCLAAAIRLSAVYRLTQVVLLQEP